ncbi:hypothetical protein [Cupriavidus oxalaticus]|uniref:hypothetical protein n=1 Tax=Cupriavidus oxalaticus TaxID=96344 RepID=UPI0031805F89
MCGGKPDLPPATDPKVEREQADADAASAANAKTAELRRQRQRQSLLAAGSGGATGGAPATTSVMAYGKDKLGS